MSSRKLEILSDPALREGRGALEFLTIRDLELYICKFLDHG